nr:MAG TPA: hypothetical protein [Caudoviricetes sp.]
MVEYNWSYGRLPFPLPVLPSSLRRVRLAGRQENVGWKPELTRSTPPGGKSSGRRRSGSIFCTKKQ